MEGRLGPGVHQQPQEAHEVFQDFKIPESWITPAQTVALLKKLGVKKPEEHIEPYRTRKQVGFKLIAKHKKAEPPNFGLDEFEEID